MSRFALWDWVAMLQALYNALTASESRFLVENEQHQSFQQLTWGEAAVLLIVQICHMTKTVSIYTGDRAFASRTPTAGSY